MSTNLEKLQSLTVVNQVYESKFYEDFKLIIGNRKRHNNKQMSLLEKSMKENGQLMPAIINEKWEIIDGQNRYLICSKLGIPFKFIQQNGLRLKDVQAINNSNTVWSTKDFLESYVAQGNSNYINVKKFWTMFPELTLMNIRVMLGDKRASHVFERGELRVKPSDVKTGEKLARALRDVKKFYPGYNRRSFVIAYLKCLNLEQFSHEQFIQKLGMNRSALFDCVNTGAYLDCIENVYNYRTRAGESLNIKYLTTLKAKAHANEMSK